ncbi:MAG: sigma 54-interacting transcriptional regulator [Clostridia bacterium]|nr:sigma 54-interacting transcriptional regulator [Clostridia bacterium]
MPDELIEDAQLKTELVRLQEENINLQAMAEHSYDGFMITNAKGIIIYCNTAFLNLIGYSRKRVLYSNMKQNINEGLAKQSAALEAMRTGKRASAMIKTATGKEILSTATPVFDENNQLKRVVCNVRDVTELNFFSAELDKAKKLNTEYSNKIQELMHGQEQTIIAVSKEMAEIIELAKKVAIVDSTVLITGETGVGKEVLAKVIHENSRRFKTGSFVKINCGAIPANLLESELFGYEPGSFTGASKTGKKGYFEVADGGTLFLDEVGELPLSLQAKLLTALQDRSITPVGGVKAKPVDVRIVSATNKSLEEMVARGEFREDLYYRLNVIPIEVPPLRERKADIVTLLNHYKTIYEKKYNVHKNFRNEVIEILISYPWPGNVRELVNLVERMFATTHGPIFTLQDLPEKYLGHEKASQARSKARDLSSVKNGTLKEIIEEIELEIVEKTLQQCSSNREAAELLDISLSSLARKIRQIKKNSQKKSVKNDTGVKNDIY